MEWNAAAQGRHSSCTLNAATFARSRSLSHRMQRQHSRCTLNAATFARSLSLGRHAMAACGVSLWPRARRQTLHAVASSCAARYSPLAGYVLTAQNYLHEDGNRRRRASPKLAAPPSSGTGQVQAAGAHPRRARVSVSASALPAAAGRACVTGQSPSPRLASLVVGWTGSNEAT
jgi:hypothetical protein